MEITSFLKLLSQTDGFGCGIFVFGCFSQFFNFVFLCCLLLLGLKFLFFKGTSLFVQYLEKIYRISPKIECCNTFDRVRDHKDCNNNSNNNGFVSKSNLVDGLDQKKPIIFHWNTDSADGLSLLKKTNKSCETCDLLFLLRDGIDLSKNRDSSTVALLETELDEKNNEESEDEESRSRSDEDQVFDVITLRTMVKRERRRGDCMRIELEKERRAAESAAEEAMAMLLKLRMEKSVVEMEAKQYKRVAEQKQVYDQEVIQSLQWMLMKLDDEEKIQY
ncbi:Protein FLOURY 1-like [Cardamine amara subsp. amara]|uniref:Protein FLOURY 1-like n=1 Tax=Cardamine amara subsp. amara TaxID=228776 RepID=A0ABD1B7B1_CARAN